MTKTASRDGVKRTLLQAIDADLAGLKMPVKDRSGVLFVRGSGLSAKWVRIKSIGSKFHQRKRLFERNLQLITSAYQP
jgi:hypothetical protein